MKGIGKVAGSSEKLARGGRSAQGRWTRAQVSEAKRTGVGFWVEKPRRKGQQRREAQAWTSSGLPSAIERLGGA